MAHLDAVTGFRVVRNEMRLLGWDTIEVTGWEDRGHGSVIRPNGEVNHWTAGSPSGTTPSLRTVTYGRPDLRNALCHTYSSRHSKPKLYIVAARVAWHAGAGSYGSLKGNADCLGHEPECPGLGRWAPGQLELQADLSRVQMDVFGYGVSNVIDHYEWAGGRKSDRNDVGGPAWRRRITTPREGFLMALSDQEQKQLYDKVMKSNVAIGEMAPQVAATHRQLTDREGHTVARKVFATNAALGSFLKGGTEINVDVDELAAALSETLGDDVAQAVGRKLVG